VKVTDQRVLKDLSARDGLTETGIWCTTRACSI